MSARSTWDTLNKENDIFEIRCHGKLFPELVIKQLRYKSLSPNLSEAVMERKIASFLGRQECLMLHGNGALWKRPRLEKKTCWIDELTRWTVVECSRSWEFGEVKVMYHACNHIIMILHTVTDIKCE